MRSHRESCDSLSRWLEDVRRRHQDVQDVAIGDGAALRDRLAREEVGGLGRETINNIKYKYKNSQTITTEMFLYQS